MTDLTPVESFDAVRRLDKTDPVLGYDVLTPLAGIGVANLQAEALTNRTEWLKKRVGVQGTWDLSGTPVLPTGAAEHKIYKVSVAGSWNGTPAEVDDLVMLINGTTDIFVFHKAAGGTVSGSTTLLVPTDYATFALALAAAQTMSYSGRITIKFEAGYVIEEPIWFDNVQMPNLDIWFADAPQDVDATTFTALLLGTYKVVFGGIDSHIGRVYGSVTVVAGDSSVLLATAGSDFKYTVGKNDYIGGVTNLQISGTTGGAAYLNPHIIGEGKLVIPTTGSGDLEWAGGSTSALSLSFGGNAVNFGALGALSHFAPISGSFRDVEFTGSTCVLTVIGGLDLGYMTVASGCDLRFDVAYGGVVRAHFPSALVVDGSLGSAVFTATASSKLLISAQAITWKPVATAGRLASAFNSSEIVINCTALTIDNATHTPTYIVDTYQNAIASLQVDAGSITGSYGSIANIPSNYIMPGVGADAGCLVRTNLAPENDWTALALLNSWTAIAGEQAAEYRIIGTDVDLRFAVEDGTTLTIGNMPAGLRPVNPSPHVVAVHDNTAAADFGHLRILANGDIVLEHPGSVSGHSVYATVRYSTL